MATLAKLMVQLGLDDQFSSKFSSISSNLRTTGAALTGAITLPLVAAGAASVKMASDLNENINKVNVVFGESASAVQTWSTTTASSLGISRIEALKATGTFGNLLTNFGLSQEAAAGMSMDIVKLSADLGSFNNLPTAQVLDAIRSGLVGESEPLRQLGIDVSDATVKAKALALGLWDGEGALSASARATTVLQLITEQSTNAYNDFAETSNGAANQTKILRAQLSDTGATIGTLLLPYLIQLLAKGVELVEGFNGLSDSQQKYIVIAAAVAAAIGPVLMVLGSIVTIAPAVGAAFTIMTGPVGIVIAALAALFIAYQTNFLGFADGVNWALDKVAEGFDATLPYIQAVADLLSSAFTAALPILTDAFDLIVTHLTETFQNVKRILDGYVNIIRGVMQIIKGIFTGDWGLIKTGVTNIVTGMKDVIGGVLDQLMTNVKFILGTVKMVFSLAWNAIKDKAVSVITSTVENVVSIVAGLASLLYNGAFNAGYAIGQGIIAGVTAIWDSVTSYVGGLVDSVIDRLKDVPGFSPIEHVGQYYGAKLGEGFGEGIASAEAAVNRAASGLTGSAATGISGGIHGGMTFNISGAGDPKATANEVFSIFSREMALTTGGV